MQARRPTAGPPLEIVLPNQPVPRPRPSLVSASSGSPRTPRSSTSPTCPSSFIFASANRKSTDSWNSSNQDELEYEWTIDQTLLLLRTLDALPAHLLTPFNGPVPPSNLLDKIARGVANAKGPLDWPHSIRATRVKLMELARLRAKESARDENRRHRPVEDDDYAYIGGEVLRQRTNTVSRRPLYRESSMDFMNATKIEIKDNDNIARLSSRLQRTDRLIPNPAYHPYSRPSLHQHPSSLNRALPPQSSHYLNPSTSSSTALNSSLSSASSRTRSLSRSASTISNSSDPYLRSLAELPENSRARRIRRTDSIRAPGPGKGVPCALKRAPSFGMLRDNGVRPTSPSSDEEEKVRTKHAKKLRVKPDTTSPSAAPTSLPRTSTKSRTKTKDVPERKSHTGSKSSCSTSSSVKSGSSTSKSSTSTATTVTIPKLSRPTAPKLKANLRRNPSIFGAELPNPQPNLPFFLSPSASQVPPPSPNTVSPPRTLRRVRATSFARRISFGSLVPPEEEPEIDTEVEGRGLGSAFQLR